ncbi:MAG: acyl-CoA dehydrogenase family protein [Rhodocyclaceae bacterium]|nr:acyl-CoA dehydrogenase family protein [Rhodocyclaceae bacterium]
MNFELTEDQSLLRESVERLMREEYDFASRRKYLAEPKGWSEAMWRRYAALGLLGLSIDERYGGSGMGSVESMIVMEAFGRRLGLEPYLATVILGAAAIRMAGTEEQKRTLLPEVAAGRRLLALAHGERSARYTLAHVATRARRDGTQWVLDGEKTLVLHGDCADTLIVAARVSGDVGDEQGISLFLVDAQTAGVHRRAYALQSDLRAADLTLRAVHVPDTALLGESETGYPVLERVIDGAISALCAEGVGALDETLDLTVDYLKKREQFGVAIGSFQALQHRAVDMLVALEQARSMSYLATMMGDEADRLERCRGVAAAKVQFGRSARSIGQAAIQLHGGIGVTMEYSVAHYFKRTTTIELLFGDADHHLSQVARLGGFVAART